MFEVDGGEWLESLGFTLTMINEGMVQQSLDTGAENRKEEILDHFTVKML